VITDAELVAAVQRGDETAFGQVYERYRARILRYCSRMLHGAAAAEDIVQETFLKARSAFHDLENGSSLSAWLFRIAHHEVLMHWRRESRSSEMPDENGEAIFDHSTPLDRVVASEAEQLLHLLLTRLKPRYREVLLLREYENLSYHDIALITQTSEQSVKSRLFKARKVLAEQLKEFYRERRTP
jgi:RNA polymerase sigma-70 factor (ECF subfamily)